MKVAKSLITLFLILLLSLCWTVAVFAAGESALNTSAETANEESSGENIEETPNNKEEEPKPEVITKPVYIYIQNSTIDYAGLNRQIAIANGLREGDYTKESWAILEAALETARYAENSTNQEVVDNATEALRVAVLELESMDLSALEQAIHLAKSYIVGDEYELLIVLSNLVKKAEGLLVSGDQEAVNVCAEEIHDVVAQFVSSLPEEEEPEVIIKEVQVEVPPSDDFCNIPKHFLWTMLFFISVGVNLILVATIVFIIRKRKLCGEDVPLVDYDIDDDM